MGTVIRRLSIRTGIRILHYCQDGRG